MAKDWADKANKVYAELKNDLSKANDRLTILKNITNEHDEVKDSENPFVALIDKMKADIEHFMDQFESV